MKPRLYNHEKKMSLINQLLYKRNKIGLKRLRIQQQQQQAPQINITINNTEFEKNNRLKEIYRRLEMIVPQERIPITPPRTPPPQAQMKQWVRSPSGNYMVLLNGTAGRRRIRMNDAEGVNTNIVESRTKPDFV